VTFQDRLEISTSEGVTVRLTIAGIGSRALAWVLDGLILFVALSIVGIVGINTVDADSLLGLGLLSLVALFLPMAYAIAFDVLNGGRTIGKMAAGTKVVRASGAPVGFGSAVVRALFVPVDFFLLGIGVIAMFATRRTQRIGDLAARTVVVRDRTTEVLDPGAPVTDLPAGPRWDVATVSNEEIGVIRSFLARSASLPPGRRAELARDLRRRVEPRVGAVSGTYPDEAFLTRVVAEKLASEAG
jgi:uncharacterized RDD family membrane protein YckC